MHTRKITILAALAVATTTFGAGRHQDGISPVCRRGRLRQPPSTTCLARPPTGYEDYTNTPPIVFTGSLEGCLYFKIDASTNNGAPSGVSLEQGREVFVGSLNAIDPGLFTTTYKFESSGTPTSPPARRSRAAASIRSSPAAASAGSPAPLGASTSRTSSATATSSTQVSRHHVSHRLSVHRTAQSPTAWTRRP